ncbi:MAG: hypothetical protein DIU61_009135 [Bacteroidota bacterium]|jgi:hypothetical protein|nr:MAG: hypothetical protein DIU61_03690 [Bacteroidota bacterium]
MKTLFSISVGIFAALLCFGAYAQFIDMSPIPDSTGIVGLKYSRASYKTDFFYDGPSGGSAVYKLYGMFPLRNGWTFNAELPFVVAKDEGGDDSGFANAYFGFQRAIGTRGKSNFGFGLYLPLISSSDYIRPSVGIVSDVYGIFEFTEAITIRLNYAHHHIAEKGVVYGFEIGPDIFFPTYSEGKTELLFHFAAKGGYAFGGFTAWAEIANFVNTSSDSWITDMMISKLVLGGQFTKPRLRPGIFYGIPLDENTTGYTKSTLHIKLDFVIGR